MDLLFPHLWVCPVVLLRRTVNHWVEGRVVLSAINNIKRFLMNLPADAVLVISGGGDQKYSGCILASPLPLVITSYNFLFGWVCRLIEHHAMGVKTVLVADVGGEHLINAPGRLIDEPFGCVQYFDTL